MPKELIDGAGNLAWAAAHSAYGAVIATQGPEDVAVDGGFVQSDGPHVESPFRLLGQVNDEDAELSWTRFRCFDADTGTWISTDPLGIAGGLNLYGFDGSPSDVVDPLGLATDGKPHRRKQTGGDVTYETEEQARAEALRRHGATPDAPYEATPVYGKNENLKGPKGEPSERVATINSEGELVEFDHHSNGHFFKDTNEYELPHYHGPNGEHISYGTSPYAHG
jgi:RHS repeat-associated protein